MEFKVFNAYGAASRPEATLRSSGYVFLSRGILKRAGDEDATHYQLLFDEDTDRLGIRLCRKMEADGDESIRGISQEKSGAALNLVPLLRYYGFPLVKEKHVFPVSFGSNLVVIDLSPLRKRGA